MSRAIFDGFASFTAALLDLTYQLLHISFSFGEIIVGDLSPLALNFSLELMPFTLNSVVIHPRLQVSDYTPVMCKRSAMPATCKLLLPLYWFFGETAGVLPCTFLVALESVASGGQSVETHA